MDTVPDTGWQEDPWSARLGADGILHGLGSTDMKGPVAAAIVAARALPERVPITLLITTDEETTKQGARLIAADVGLVRQVKPTGIIVAEPTGLAPVRGHRSHIAFTCVATGVQAHSSTGRGRNANWALIPFLMEMKGVFERLRSDASLQDADYDPPFSDFNVVIDNHGAAVNVTVPKATARIKFRYSAKVDPAPVLAGGARRGRALRHRGERGARGLSAGTAGGPSAGAALRRCDRQAAGTAPYGTDASELQAIAPCVVLGPGDIARGTHADREGARRRPRRRGAGVHGAGRALSAGLRRRAAAQQHIVGRRLAAIGRRQVARDAVGDARSGSASRPSSCRRTSVIGLGRMKSTASAFGTRRASAATRRLHSCHTAAPGESAGGISLLVVRHEEQDLPRVCRRTPHRSASRRSIAG